MSGGQPLRHELEEWVDTPTDLEDLLQNTHNLLRLARPLILLIRFLDSIRRWEVWTLCLVLLVSSNCACLILNGYYMVFSLMTVMALAGLGYSHRQTNILAKVIPSPEPDPPKEPVSEPVSLDSDQLNSTELLDEFRLLLSFMNIVTKVLTQFLLRLYSMLKWDNLNTSLRCYTLLTVLVIVFHVFPLRWTSTFLLDIFLLHYPVYQYFLVIRGMQKTINKKQSSDTKPSRFSDPDSKSDTECSLGTGCIPETKCSLGAGLHCDPGVATMPEPDIRCNQATGHRSLQDPEEQAERSEGGSSSDEAVEIKMSDVASLNADTISLGKGTGKRSGVVGKIIKTVKNVGPAGSCAGCNVNFTTILKRRRLCSHCGNHFCSRCCGYKVTRSMFGATAPAAQTETVNVCFYCFSYLNKLYRDITISSSKTAENSVPLSHSSSTLHNKTSCSPDKQNSNQTGGSGIKQNSSPNGGGGTRQNNSPTGSSGTKQNSSPTGGSGTKQNSSPTGGSGIKQNSSHLEGGSNKQNSPNAKISQAQPVDRPGNVNDESISVKTAGSPVNDFKEAQFHAAKVL